MGRLTVAELQQAAMRRVQRIHFVGIGGAGMCGIAEVMLNLSFPVSGSDIAVSKNTMRLEQLGAEITLGHAAKNIEGCSVVVISSAVSEKNPEVVAAHDAGIPVVPRAQMLAELMRFRFGIAIAGTHGKTSTTSLTASLLAQGGLDPTFVIGGLLNSHGTNAQLGESRYLVAEVDESDATFLLMQPMISVITNIDADHLGTYGNDFERLRQAFVEFVHHLPFYGMAVLCIDDDEIRSLLPQINRPYVTYGFSKDADIRATDLLQSGFLSSFVVMIPGREAGLPITLNMPGRHNVLNALAAIAVAHEVNVSDKAIQTGLSEFQGVGRRFNMKGVLSVNGGTALLVDDYAHHPSELRAALTATREGWPEQRVVAVFQPHRFSRTYDLFDDFVEVLADHCDLLVLCDVYPAGEDPIVGADGRALARAIRTRCQIDPVFVSDIEQLPNVLGNVLENGDVVITLGAGSIGSASNMLVEQMGVAQ
jgi:UDP-N-acetylmuramate--alanine ligase